MPNDAEVTLQTGQLPEDFCFESWQQVYESFITATTAFLSGQYTVWNFGSQTPAPEDRNKPWYRTNVDGSPDRTYVFFENYWLSPYGTPESGSERRIWVGSLEDLKTYDGGEDAAVTNKTGPFWERDTTFNARMPIGVGTLPSSTSVSVTGTGGAESVSLVGANIPNHFHEITYQKWQADGNAVDASGNLVSFNGTDSSKNTETDGGDDPVTAHNNMPPYIGVYFIKRTARKFYRLPA